MVCYMFVVAVCCPWVVLILSFVLSLTFLFFLYFFFFLFFWFSLFFFFFFFSSRRRHTRSTRDWGSDVCSSDLFARPPAPRRLPRAMSQAAWSSSIQRAPSSLRPMIALAPC